MSTTSGRTLEINLLTLDAPFLSTDAPRQAITQDVQQPNTNEPPQIIFMRNTLPTAQGFSSLDQQEYTGSIGIATVEHCFTFTAKDGLEYQCAKAAGALYFSRVGETTWTEFALPSHISTYDLTVADLDGETYFFISSYKAYTFQPQQLTLVEVDFVGIQESSLNGITAASGYLIAFDTDTVYWDSPATRANFTPQTGGASSGKIAQLKGDIVCVLPLANGYIVYSNTNAVAAQYSGNPNFPWVFREVPKSSGVSNQYNVAFQNNFASHFAWTQSGLQEVTFTQASSAAPELSEFLNKRTVEEFFPGIGFRRTKYSRAHMVKLQMIAHRYLTVSFGPEGQPFTQACIFDLQLKRWGRLNKSHVALFGWSTDQRDFFQSYAYEYAHLNRVYNELQNVRYSELKAETAENPALTVRIGSCDQTGLTHAYERVELENTELPITGLTDDFYSEIVLSRISFFKNRPALLHEVEVQNFVPLVTYPLVYNGEALYDGAEEHDGGISVSFIYLDGSHTLDGSWYLGPIVDGQFVAQVWLYSSMNFDPFADESLTAKRPFTRPRSKFVQRFTQRRTARHFGLSFAGKYELTNLLFQYEQAGYR